MKFKQVLDHAKSKGVCVERCTGRRRYDVWRKSDSSQIHECQNLQEVQQAIADCTLTK